MYLTNELAIGPTPRVTPTRMDGINETEPRPSLNSSMRRFMKVPKE